MNHQSLAKRSAVVSTKVGAAVVKSVDKYFSNSSIVDSKDFAAIPRLNHNDVEIGKFLGQGSFGNVYNVIRISLTDNNKSDNSNSKEDWNDALMEGAQEGHFALKCLNPATTALDVKTLFTSTADLAMEAKLLSSLNHKNIVKIHAIADCYTPTSFVLDDVYGLFYIVDRIEMTLSEKIDEWAQATKPIKAKLKNGVSSLSSSPWSSLRYRLEVALEIASGLQYLHSLRLMHRDVKPENIGFDINGNVKILDLGTSKEIQPSTTKEQEGTIPNPTGMIGTTRYMAPEVALSKYYDLSADVYSFGILLWEVCSLKLPFKKYETKKHLERVVRGKERPKLDPSWSVALKNLMNRCWSDDSMERPEFEFICSSLRMEISSPPTSSASCSTAKPGRMAVDDEEGTENDTMSSSSSIRRSFRSEKNVKNSARSKRSLLRRAALFVGPRT